MAFLGCWAAGAQASPLATAFAAGELAQGYRDGFVLAAPAPDRMGTVDSEEAAAGERVPVKFPRFAGVRLIELPAGESVPAALDRLRATGRYSFVEPDYIKHAYQVTPNDPDFSQQWGLSNPGGNGGIAGSDIHAVGAWNVNYPATTSAANVIVAVIDTGILTTHQDLIANLWVNPNPNQTFNYAALGQNYKVTDSLYGLNAVAGSGLPTDDGTIGHGTHVSGILGAVGNNSVGVCGVAWKVQIMALKFLDSTGSGTTSAEIGCIDYAIAKKANIINASFGSSSPSQAELTAVQAAGQAGIIFVAAAGNSSENIDIAPGFPADYPLDNVVAVGASDSRDTPAGFSNYGSGSVELFAPGVGILSTYNTSNSSYALLDGTSMATPFTAGSLALLKAQYPNDTYRELINRLLNGVDKAPKLTGLCQTGGRLDLANSINPATSVNSPPNATFATRTVLVGLDPYTRDNNADSPAAPEAGTPVIAGTTGGHSLWWQWTAPESATVEIDTSGTYGGAIGLAGGSAYATLLGVYTGGSLGALTPVASSANFGTESITPGGARIPYSEVTFHATAGTTYQINIQGQNGASGQTILAINTTPDNDSFSSPTVLTGLSTSLDDANVNATRQAGEPEILGISGGHTLWYSWTAPRTAQAQLAAYSYEFPPGLAVYTGSSLGSLTLVTAARSGTASGVTTLISECLCTFNATAGTTYMIQMDGTPTAGVGEFTLALDDSRWQATTGDAVTCTPAVGADGSVYVGSDDNSFYAFNPDGSLKWTHAAGSVFDTSAAAIGTDGTIYAGCFDGNLYAFNQDGSLKWTYSVPTPANPSLDNGVASSPALAADGTIYFKDDDGNLYALNPDGSLKWTAPVSGFSYAAPTVGSDGTIYIGSDSGTLYALAPGGATKWSFATPSANDQIYTAAALDAAGNLYFGTLNGYFYSVSAAGTLRWSFTAGDGVTSAPAIGANGTVYFGCYNSEVYALSTTSGALQWSYTLGGQVRASAPAIDANGVIYIGSYDHNVYALNPGGSLNRIFATDDWVRSSPTISGTTLFVGSNDHKVYAFDIGTAAAGSPWPMYQFSSLHPGRAAIAALAITGQPTTQSIAIGSTLTLSVAAVGQAPLAYQWYLNGAAISGAVNSTYVVPTVSTANGGAYTVTVSGPQGSVTSAAASIAVGPPVAGHIVNLSARAQVGAGGSILITGFVIGGTGSKNVLLRGVGPTLATVGVSGALAQPQLTLLNSAQVALGSNLAWGGSAALVSAFAQVGAFQYSSATSADTALLEDLPAAAYTSEVSGVNGTTGVALAEIYDADTTATGTSLINISARAQVGVGANILIAGFVIAGNQPVQLLLRGVGPGLASAGLSASTLLANPQLSLYDSAGSVLQTNTGWGGGATLSNAFKQVGAFSLSPTSTDSAMIVTLQPGSYTEEVSGVGGTSGVALAEVYLMSP